MTRHYEKLLVSQAGFTLIELVLVLTLVGILAVTAAGPGFGIIGSSAQESQRDGVVAAIRSGINMQYSLNLTGGSPTYPANLDGATDGDCVAGNPCFTGVLVDAVISDWSKSGNVYTHVATGTAYTYTDTTGTFQ